MTPPQSLYEKMVLPLSQIKKIYFSVNNHQYPLDIKGFKLNCNVPIDIIIEMKGKESE